MEGFHFLTFSLFVNPIFRSRLIFTKNQPTRTNISISVLVTVVRKNVAWSKKRLSPIASDEKSRDKEQQSIRHSLKRNDYPSWLINQNIS